jgi:hypothetical protein
MTSAVDVQGGGARPRTEIAYVCSPDEWQHQLFASMRSLLASGTTFDRLVIHCVGTRPEHWSFADPRIVVREVEPIDPGYFLLNKVRACESDAERVVYLDTDTLVLRPLDDLVERDEDLTARVVSYVATPEWSADAWARTLRDVAGAEPGPYFNSGFFVLRGGAQHALGPAWRRIATGGHTRTLFDPVPLHGKGFEEQLAMSIAAAAEGLRCGEMDPTDHAYAWADDPWRGARVFHTGGHAFWRFAPRIEARIGTSGRDLPRFTRGGLGNPVHRRRLRRRFLSRPLLLLEESLPARLRGRLERLV